MMLIALTAPQAEVGWHISGRSALACRSNAVGTLELSMHVRMTCGQPSHATIATQLLAEISEKEACRRWKPFTLRRKGAPPQALSSKRLWSVSHARESRATGRRRGVAARMQRGNDGDGFFTSCSLVSSSQNGATSFKWCTTQLHRTLPHYFCGFLYTVLWLAG
eukprot:6174412-Pleurochrysis_carterae.AAC.6